MVCGTLTFIGCRLLGEYANGPMGIVDWIGNVTGFILISFYWDSASGFWMSSTGRSDWGCVLLGRDRTCHWTGSASLDDGICRRMPDRLARRTVCEGIGVVLFATQWFSRFGVGGILFCCHRIRVLLSVDLGALRCGHCGADGIGVAARGRSRPQNTSSSIPSFPVH